jgi:FkbM family methyltransferase
MNHTEKPVAFVLISSQHGTLIVNKNDYCVTSNNMVFGVGFQLLTKSSYDRQEIMFLLEIIRKKRELNGNGVVAIDCGANIGVNTIEWANAMHDWGQIIAFEAQEKIFYALAGNIAINNCFNVTARHAAVGASCGFIDIPEPDYNKPASYGSLELHYRANNEYIGQDIDYQKTKKTPIVSIDSLNLDRCDFIKIDVEGMESEVLAGASNTLERLKPVMWIEILKSNKEELCEYLKERGYKLFVVGMNMLVVHQDDPVIKKLQYTDNNLSLH